jgi:hypothetical protein
MTNTVTPRLLLALALVGAGASFSTSALAVEPQPASTQPPEAGAAPPTEATAPAAATAATTEAAPAAPVDPRQTPGNDDARFRGAIQLDLGGFTYPAAPLAMGVAGLSAQLGAQIDDNFGVVLVPAIDILFGAVGGVSLSSAILVDYTLDSTWSFGAGPDFGVFGAIGGTSTEATAAGGVNYGARLRAAFYPALARGGDKVRRKAFALGLDMRLLGGPAAAATVSTEATSATASASTFIFSPMLTVGYQAF